MTNKERFVQMDLITFYFVRGFFGFANLLPLKIRKSFIGAINSTALFFVPSSEKVSRRNLRLVFPDATELEISQMFASFKASFTRFVIDCMRFEKLSKDWYKTNVRCPFNDTYHAIKADNNGKGILVVSGHIGSIELQAFVAPLVGRKFSFVARAFKGKRLQYWWNKRREMYGNKVIARNGAVANIIEYLNSGTDVAILIDQNVKRKHAIFTNWFGRPAATTFAAGLAAVETGARIVVSAIVYDKDDSYTVHEHECVVTHVLKNESLTKEEKISEVTRLISEAYQKVILNHPSEWFWLHRRWKTEALENVPESFYANC